MRRISLIDFTFRRLLGTLHEVFSRSFFAHPDDFSAGELVAMFHAYFLGSSEGLLFDVPRDDYDSCLWFPLRRYLGLGGKCLTSVAWLDRGTNCCGSGWDPAPRSKRRRLCSRPIRPVCRDSLSNLDWVMSRGGYGWRQPVGTPRSRFGACGWTVWLHDRPAFLGTSGFGPLDNISVLERFEEVRGVGRRRVVVRLLSCAYALVEELDERVVKDRLLAELHRVYPELRGPRSSRRSG